MKKTYGLFLILLLLSVSYVNSFSQSPPSAWPTFNMTVKNIVSSPNGQRDSICLLYTSPSPRDGLLSRMPSSA